MPYKPRYIVQLLYVLRKLLATELWKAQEHKDRSLDPKAINDPLSGGPGKLANYHSVPKASPNDRD